MARGRSELGVEDLRCHLTHALANIGVVHTVLEGSTLGDALGEAGTIGDGDTSGSGGKLAVLLVVIEGSELVDHS